MIRAEPLVSRSHRRVHPPEIEVGGKKGRVLAMQTTAKLYVIRGSHACRAGMLMLDHKGIDYRTVVLPTGLHPLLVRLHGFPAVARRQAGDRRSAMLNIIDRLGTVPALRYDGQRMQTNREIARFLDSVQPEPPLFPANPQQREQVEEAEHWADEVLQMTARRLALATALHGPDAMLNRGNDGRLGPLLWRNDTIRFVGARVVGRTTFAVSTGTESRLLESLPGILDHIDAWIDAGVLNGAALNAADFMVAPSLALLCYRPDLASEIEARPAGELVERLLPEPPGQAGT